MKPEMPGSKPTELPSRELVVFGREQPPPPPLRLRAGPLTMRFEPDTAFLRRIRLGKTEILRGIYAAVRDQNWGTAPPQISNLTAQISEDSFALAFDVDCQQGDLHFRWHGEIHGAADGSVKFSFAGETLTRFLRNRIGFCVLHPICECADVAARQRRTDGSVVECRFPRTIEPQIFGQGSFRDLRAVAHEVAPGLWAEVEFAGDVFEMEDQRNWTDASFKTYCTPLAIPFPVEVPAGTRIRQEVKLRLIGQVGETAPQQICVRDEFPILTMPTQPSAALPKLGLGIARDEPTPTASANIRLSALQLAHLRVEVRLGEDRWQTALQKAIQPAAASSLPLELAVHLPAHGGDTGLKELHRFLAEAEVRVARVLALRQSEPATSKDTLVVVRRQLGKFGAPVGGGTDAHFCELNREQALKRFGLAAADFLSWPITPQVHAFDDLSLMETIEAQADTLVTARTFAEGKPLIIAPVTLKPRFNAVATTPKEDLTVGGGTKPSDPRQASLFCAAWTLGSIAALARGGAASATFFETTGPGGIMDSRAAVFPVYHVLAWLAGFTAWSPVTGSLPDSVVALAVFAPGGRRRLLLGNLSPEPVSVKLAANDQPRVVILDETTVSRATQTTGDFALEESSRGEIPAGRHLLPEPRSSGRQSAPSELGEKSEPTYVGCYDSGATGNQWIQGEGIRLRAHAVARVDFA